MTIRSPGRYPEPPDLWELLKLRNSASHDCLPSVLPLRFCTSREVMWWTTLWSVLASSHQCPVAPSQLVALASRTQTTRPGWSPCPTPIGLLDSSLGLKGSAAIPTRCWAMSPAAGTAASDLRKHLLCMTLLLPIRASRVLAVNDSRVRSPKPYGIPAASSSILTGGCTKVNPAAHNRFGKSLRSSFSEFTGRALDAAVQLSSARPSASRWWKPPGRSASDIGSGVEPRRTARNRILPSAAASPDCSDSPCADGTGDL